MKRILLALAMALLACAPASAIPANWQPVSIGQQTFAAGSLATAQALTIPAGGAIEAFIVCEGQNVRWRDDGVDPTASVGTLLLPSQPFPYIANLPRLKLIEATSGASCTVTYYK